MMLDITGNNKTTMILGRISAFMDVQSLGIAMVNVDQDVALCVVRAGYKNWNHFEPAFCRAVSLE